jgi:hypothetical protein
MYRVRPGVREGLAACTSSFTFDCMACRDKETLQQRLLLAIDAGSQGFGLM